MPIDSPPGRRPAALLIAVGAVVAEGVASLGFAAWLLLRGTREEPSNQGVLQGTTAYLLLMGALVLGVALALWLQKRWAFGAGVFLQLLGLGVTYQMASGGFWTGAVLLGLACVGTLVALFSAPARAALGRA
jgi:hypothetical protein